MKYNKKPTAAELEILQVLWEEGPSSVRAVHEQLASTKDVFYTTILKTMQVMVGKKLLDRDTSQRSHIYKPLVEREETEHSMVNNLLNTVFGGSTSRLVISALGSGKPSAKELEEIKSLIEKIDEDGVGERD
ncbi:MAG: BlaI/MecI/CopY family transcriptional regulator [Saprospiraceae bacterium]|nr:BlaI/MecI/CopY family transcriptional regulator [Saprospiraceae bacterium]